MYLKVGRLGAAADTTARLVLAGARSGSDDARTTRHGGNDGRGAFPLFSSFMATAALDDRHETTVRSSETVRGGQEFSAAAAAARSSQRSVDGHVAAHTHRTNGVPIDDDDDDDDDDGDDGDVNCSSSSWSSSSSSSSSSNSSLSFASSSSSRAEPPPKSWTSTIS